MKTVICHTAACLILTCPQIINSYDKWHFSLWTYPFWGRSPPECCGSVLRTEHTAKGEKSAFLRMNIPSPIPHTITYTSEHRLQVVVSPIKLSTRKNRPVGDNTLGWYWEQSYQLPLIAARCCLWDPLLWNPSSLLPLARPVTQRKSSSASKWI